MCRTMVILIAIGIIILTLSACGGGGGGSSGGNVASSTGSLPSTETPASTPAPTSSTTKYSISLETKVGSNPINAKLTVNGVLITQKYVNSLSPGTTLKVVLEDPVTIGSNQYIPVGENNYQYTINSDLNIIYQYEALPPIPGP